MKNKITIVFLLMVNIYLTFAFIEYEINPGKWGMELRDLCAWLIFLSLFISGIYLLIDDNDKK